MIYLHLRPIKVTHDPLDECVTDVVTTLSPVICYSVNRRTTIWNHLDLLYKVPCITWKRDKTEVSSHSYQFF